MFRDSKFDKLKSPAQVKRDIGKICKVCGKPVTMFEGPGSDCLCREHQLTQAEYGGMGRIDRPHTFHRSTTCSCCGADIDNDTRWEKAGQYFGIVLTEKQKHEIKRRYMHGDHKVRRASGGDDSAENTEPLCSFCHWVKTVYFNDGRKRDTDDELEE